MARMETQVEELPDNRVRLQVEVEPGDVRHAVEHAASDLAETMKIPGFRKGRVPMPVLVALSIGETKTIEAELADGSTTSIEATVKEIKEKVLPPLDDELARATSEFETLAELRADIESRLRAALELVLEAAADKLGIDVSDEELEAEIRERIEDPDDAIPQLRESGRFEQERESLRLSRALDRIAAGAKGKRMALPNAKILIHQVSGGFQGQATDIEIQARETIALKRRMEEIIAEHTDQPLDRVSKDMERDYFMSPEEAKEYGIIDNVIVHRAAAAAAAAAAG